MLVAEQVATLAAIAPGQFVLQCAVGDGAAQFAGMGVDLASRRVGFESAIDVIRRLLAGEEVTSDGPWSVQAACIGPRPPEPVHLWIAAAATRPSTWSVHHVALLSSDVERTVAFYQDLLGFPLTDIFANRDYKGSSHFFFDIGHGNLLAFFDFPGLGLGPVVEAHGGVQHIAISVTPEAWDAARARLDAAGVSYHGPGPGMETSIYVKDPDNIAIELLAEPLLEMMGKPIGDEP